jgi:hypothetical protein
LSGFKPAIAQPRTPNAFDALIVGDVASPFAERLDGPSQSAAGDGTSAGEVPAAVAAGALPESRRRSTPNAFASAIDEQLHRRGNFDDNSPAF